MFWPEKYVLYRLQLCSEHCDLWLKENMRTELWYLIFASSSCLTLCKISYVAPSSAELVLVHVQYTPCICIGVAPLHRTTLSPASQNTSKCLGSVIQQTWSEVQRTSGPPRGILGYLYISPKKTQFLYSTSLKSRDFVLNMFKSRKWITRTKKKIEIFWLFGNF